MKPVIKTYKHFIVIGFMCCLFILGTSPFWLSALSSEADAANDQVSTNQNKGDEGAAQSIKELHDKQLRDQEEAQKQADSKFSKLQEQVSSFLQKQPGTYGFMLETSVTSVSRVVEETIGYNQAESFKMASTYKVPVVLYLYEQVAAGKISLDDQLVYQSRFYTTGTGSLQYQKPGGSYSVRQLASLSIRESDNVALYILIDKLGRDNILNFMRSLGGTAVYDNTPFGTPNDLVLYMKAVNDFATLHPDLGNYLLTDLKNTDFNDRIRAGTPAEIAVAHKIGNLGGVVNDVGIVYAPKGAYILALTAKNVADEGKAAEVEAEVAKMIYSAIGK